MRISDWSSDVCSSDLPELLGHLAFALAPPQVQLPHPVARGAEALRKEQVVLVLGINVRHAVLVAQDFRSEEHTSELQSLMRISYAVFCLKNKIDYSICIHIM